MMDDIVACDDCGKGLTEHDVIYDDGKAGNWQLIAREYQQIADSAGKR